MRIDTLKIEEYPMKAITTHGVLTQQQLNALNEAEKQKPKPVYKPPEPTKTCPLKSGMKTACDGESCAWWSGERCAQTCPHPAAGRKCPHKHTACAYDCALRSDTE